MRKIENQIWDGGLGYGVARIDVPPVVTMLESQSTLGLNVRDKETIEYSSTYQ